MHHMYRLDAFLQSCPADQDIINHYKLQQVWHVTNSLDFFFIACFMFRHIIMLSLQSMKMKKHEELETPTFTTSIPIEVNDD